MAATVCNLHTQEQQMFQLTVPERKCDCCGKIIPTPPDVIVYGQKVFLWEQDNDYYESSDVMFFTEEVTQ